MSSPDLSIPSLFNVQGKIALVTGGGSGIGKMIAVALAQNGAKVYIAARKESQLKEAADEINKTASGKVEFIVADVGSKAGCDALVNEIKQREPKLHILVNNSGVTWGAPFDDVPEVKGWDNIFAVNVKSIFYMTAGLADFLAKDSTSEDPGRVINISSTASVAAQTESNLSDAGFGLWSYATSKAAVNHLTSQLAVKLVRRHVMVNAILPGVFPSKMTAWGLKKHGNQMSAEQPTGRLGIPQDMAGLALFLVSPASAHVTGTHIILDGGATIAGQRLTPQVKL
jgi:NAD(P)-dependent dehydrogenase (short-subunit alcohol dehydrogenase family)